MHLHSIEVALQGGPVPPRFISIKWGGTSAPPEFTGGYIIKVLFFGEVHAIHRAGHRPPESPTSNLLYYSSVLPVAVKPVLRWNRDTRHNPLGRSMTRSPQLIYQLTISCGGRFASFSFCIFWAASFQWLPPHSSRHQGKDTRGVS